MNGYFIAGTIFGAYIAQNYKVPDVHKICVNAIKKIKELEK